MYDTFFLKKIILLIAIASMGSACVSSAIVGGTAMGANAAFDHRPVGQQLDDKTIATTIDGRLLAEKNMPSRWVSVEVINAVVTLTGYLPSAEHIDRAIYICQTSKGVVEVRNELEIGSPTIGSLVSDSWITTQIKTRLLADKNINGSSVHIETVNGRVYLQGVAISEDEIRRAIDITRMVRGVTAVVDMMSVKRR
ncbi:MAG: BON domain-containing protein [Mariprofundaceae bacterium]|nr:BON domain-containing protein [Mariprofundaceae bacterium]